MLNYMRSEWYRIFHTKALWVFTGVLAGLLLAMNAVLYLMGRGDPRFPYSTIRFSLSPLLSNMLMMGCSGLALASILFSDKSQGGIMKNAVAYGISRTRIFAGKCILSSAAAFLSMLVILAVYVAAPFGCWTGNGSPMYRFSSEGYWQIFPLLWHASFCLWPSSSSWEERSWRFCRGWGLSMSFL